MRLNAMRRRFWATTTIGYSKPCRIPKLSVRLVLRLYLGFLLITTSLTMGQTIGVDYGALSARQQSLFQSLSGCSSSSTCLKKWQELTSSEELEFAGGTQALN